MVLATNETVLFEAATDPLTHVVSSLINDFPFKRTLSLRYIWASDKFGVIETNYP